MLCKREETYSIIIGYPNVISNEGNSEDKQHGKIAKIIEKISNMGK